MKQQNKSKRGGKREGAGAKAFLINPVIRKVYLDKETSDFMEFLGNGSVSAGIRKAAKMIKSQRKESTHA